MFGFGVELTLGCGSVQLMNSQYKCSHAAIPILKSTYFARQFFIGLRQHNLFQRPNPRQMYHIHNLVEVRNRFFCCTSLPLL